MISREELQAIGKFRAKENDAVSLYFEPPAPAELAHRDEPILLKEKIQQRLGSLQGGSPSVRADIDRLIEMATRMKGNHQQTKVVFACAREKLWHEFDVPGEYGLHFDVGGSFMLAPLIGSLERPKRYCIALADRNRARLLLLEAGRISEHTQVLDEENEKVRMTGTGGSRKAERQKEEKVKRHFQFLSDHLLHFHEHGDFDSLLIGCRSELWAEIEAVLHSDLKRILVGHFAVDPGLATQEEVKLHAEELIGRQEKAEELQLVDEVAGEAARDGQGAVGLAAVVRSIEKGEVRILLLSESKNGTHAKQSASICTECGHIRLGTSARCDLCSGEMNSFTNAEEAVLRSTLARGIEVRVLRTARLPADNGCAALLRFRADHNTAQALAS